MVIERIKVKEHINPFGTIGLTTAFFFFSTVLCWSRFFTWASHHDQSFYSTLFTYPKKYTPTSSLTVGVKRLLVPN